ncbi:hypothetical protein [Trichormus variabilis]|uniref:Nitrile hydratase alpha /Thiocyanate hydrolase gamma domain-containing protein n=1 Tax=Trichormus variabilis SAG 1403-4b TaxID=447716 RepID=A0A3S1BXG8_ANAVA|nr:hypothetical protein [Trichormus variabilis]MBD2625931.1 hypothetical protein [Trichormus variabilis FACHB-164]RUS93246.1 hypothetical protein DSM107003_45620 [Trichormus variabilis SAG 1403-4b]
MVLQPGWQQIGQQVSQLIARAWLDSDFKERLINHPRITLQEEGIEIPEGVEVIIDQSTYNWSVGSEAGYVVWRIPVPPKPANISEEELSAWRRGNVSRELEGMIPKCC